MRTPSRSSSPVVSQASASQYSSRDRVRHQGGERDGMDILTALPLEVPELSSQLKAVHNDTLAPIDQMMLSRQLHHAAILQDPEIRSRILQEFVQLEQYQLTMTFWKPLLHYKPLPLNPSLRQHLLLQPLKLRGNYLKVRTHLIDHLTEISILRSQRLSSPLLQMFSFPSNKSYKIFIAPEFPEDLDPYCFMPIGEGSTFCLNQHCQINHRGGGDRLLIMPGEAYIQSDKNRAFKEPSTNALIWDDGLYEKWSRDCVPAEEWLKRFQLLKNRVSQEPKLQSINHNDVIDEQAFTQKIKNVQSVRKRKLEAIMPSLRLRFQCQTRKRL